MWLDEEYRLYKEEAGLSALHRLVERECGISQIALAFKKDAS